MLPWREQEGGRMLPWRDDSRLNSVTAMVLLNHLVTYNVLGTKVLLNLVSGGGGRGLRVSWLAGQRAGRMYFPGCQ